jgi:hypothetical protein
LFVINVIREANPVPQSQAPDPQQRPASRLFAFGQDCPLLRSRNCGFNRHTSGFGAKKTELVRKKTGLCLVFPFLFNTFAAQFINTLINVSHE